MKNQGADVNWESSRQLKDRDMKNEINDRDAWTTVEDEEIDEFHFSFFPFFLINSNRKAKRINENENDP